MKVQNFNLVIEEKSINILKQLNLILQDLSLLEKKILT